MSTSFVGSKIAGIYSKDYYFKIDPMFQDNNLHFHNINFKSKKHKISMEM